MTSQDFKTFEIWKKRFKIVTTTRILWGQYKKRQFSKSLFPATKMRWNVW